MHKKILDYLKEYEEPLDSEETVLAWWKGLQGVTNSLDDLTEAIEELEDKGAIEKQEIEKDLFVYRITAAA